METSVAPVAATLSGDRLSEAVTQLQAAADARKCWPCGCLRHALEAFDRAIPEPERPAVLAEAMASAHCADRVECHCGVTHVTTKTLIFLG